MTEKYRGPAERLTGLLHHRWAVPTLAALSELGGGAKFVTIQNRLEVSRDSLVRTLNALMRSRWVTRNPGYGHPMRPEYLLAVRGRGIGPSCSRMVRRLSREGIAEMALNKWSLPVLYALSLTGGRFNEIRAQLRPITPRALTLALRDLENSGLVTRALVDGHPPHAEYTPTGKGRALIPVLNKLAEMA